MNRSESINELVAALCKAQLSFGAVLKDAENPAYSRGERKSMYATLDSVIAATRDPLASNGLVVIALPHEISDSNRLSITSMLAHTSGQFIESTLTMAAVDKVTPQEIGKLITYARRYQWTSLTGCAPEDDDDGNKASGVGSKEAAKAVATEKLKEAAKGDETVILSICKDNSISLAGNGLPIVMANLDGKQKAALGLTWEGKLAVIPAAHGFEFVALCEKNKVATIWMDAPPPAGSTNATLPKANIPSMHDFIESASNGDGDPIIVSAKRIERAGKKPFLAVEWDGKKINVFDKSVWPHLEHHVNRPAMLATETKGQYTNLIAIERLDGAEFFTEPIQD